jgi:hypothetical protein
MKARHVLDAPAAGALDVGKSISTTQAQRNKLKNSKTIKLLYLQDFIIELISFVDTVVPSDRCGICALILDDRLHTYSSLHCLLPLSYLSLSQTRSALPSPVASSLRQTTTVRSSKGRYIAHPQISTQRAGFKSDDRSTLFCYR